MSEYEELKEFIGKNCFECGYCHDIFDSEEERDAHVFQVHSKEVERDLANIERLSKEHEETITNFKEKLEIEILEKLAKENPRMLYDIRMDVSGKLMDKLIEEELFKKSLRCRMPSKFDLMWTQDPNFEKAEREAKELREQKEQREEEIQKEVQKVNERELISKDIENLSKETQYLILKRYLESKKTKRD